MSKPKLLSATGRPLATPAPRIAIAVPSGDHVAAGFAFDLARLVGYTTLQRPDLDLRLYTMKSTLLPDGRNGLVKEALRAECSHLFWLDADMRFPKDTLLRLLAHDAPFVGANYPTRRFPHVPTAEIAGRGLVYVNADAEGLLEVSRLGFGVVLTKTDVFRAMPQPWFALAWNPRLEEFTGEDIYLCRTATAAGFPPHIDLRLSTQVEHLGEMAYTNAHALTMRELQLEDKAAPEHPADGPVNSG